MRKFFVSGACIFVSHLSHGADAAQYMLTMRAMDSAIAAKASKAVEGRWIAVETVSLSARDGRQLSRNLFSVDCRQPEGIELISTSVNVETDADKGPRWEGGIRDEYASGFNSKLIRHSSLAEFGENMRVQAGGVPVKLSYPDAAHVAVAYGCAVVARGMSEEQAAEYAMKTAGASDVVDVSCVVDGPSGKSIWKVGFSEKMGWVRVNGRWVEKSKVSQNDVRWVRADVKTLIDRKSGTISMMFPDFNVSGACEVDGADSKF